MKRSATNKDINQAYRKLAMQWHPDKHEGEEKKKAEKMFYDIAAAKEVLSDKGGYLDIINCTCIVITGVIIIENIISI